MFPTYEKLDQLIWAIDHLCSKSDEMAEKREIYEDPKYLYSISYKSDSGYFWEAAFMRILTENWVHGGMKNKKESMKKSSIYQKYSKNESIIYKNYLSRIFLQ